MSLSLSVLSQSGPPKSVGGVGGRGGGVVYLTSTGQYIGVATFFFLYEPGLKLDEKSIENGLEGQKFLVVCLFWGGCHHPNRGAGRRPRPRQRCPKGLKTQEMVTRGPDFQDSSFLHALMTVKTHKIFDRDSL